MNSAPAAMDSFCALFASGLRLIMVFDNYGSALIFLVNHLKYEKRKNLRFSHARLSYPSVLSGGKEAKKNPQILYLTKKRSGALVIERAFLSFD